MSTLDHRQEAPSFRLATAAGGRRRIRLAGIAAGVFAALAVWFVAEAVLGVELRSPAAGDTAPSEIGASHVAVAATVGGLAGWALLAALERFTARATRIWTALAALALLLSLGGPLSGTGITPENRAALVAMHLVVAAVIVTALRRRGPERAGD